MSCYCGHKDCPKCNPEFLRKKNDTFEFSQDAWVVWTNSDLTEGKGRRVVHAVCLEKATALRYAKGNGVQGSDCEIEKIRIGNVGNIVYGPIRLIHPSIEDEKKQKEIDAMESAKKKALAAGLTEEDIKALLGAKM